MFHLPISQCTVTLKDIVLILKIQENGLPVIGATASNHRIIQQECLLNFGVAPIASDCRGSFIKQTWLHKIKHGIMLTDHEAIERYTRCHIMSLFGTTLSPDKSGAGCIGNFYLCSVIFPKSGHTIGDGPVFSICICLCVGLHNMIVRIWMSH
ncbi:hypothetical protein Ahy_B09g098345 [Arachis hypogaea]|uniref:Uncharacterized protein n=1 Tax=Arachis hypogaea TaxID=3818 RepID=A0A444XR08_ARAHY|nr:hypothetical protein Ahy_B09g098345 [Arachis hypogaea]